MKTLTFATLVLLINSLLCTANANELLDRMELSIYNDFAGSTELLAGEFADAERKIKADLASKIRLGDSADQIAQLKNNLCVAQVMLDDKEAASATCQQAVTAAKNSWNRLVSQRSTFRKLRATALSNRGLMHALTGDLEKAITDFNLALHLHPNFSQAERNLSAALSTNPQETLAIN